MAWLQVHQTLKDHRKLFDAADQLEVEPPHMMGLLVSFWLWALDNAPTGSLVDITPRMISRAAQWDGDPEKLAKTLIRAGWIDEKEDGTLEIHDWYEYAGKLIDQRQAEKERSRSRRAAAAASADASPDDPTPTAGRPASSRKKAGGRVDQSREDKTREGILPPIASILATVLPMLTQIISTVLPVLANLIAALLPVITPLLEVALQIVNSVIMPLLPPLMQLIEALLPPVVSLLNAIMPLLSPLLAILEPIANVLGTIVGWVSKIVSFGSGVISKIAGLFGGGGGGSANVSGYATGGFTSGPSIAGEDPRYPTEAVISFNPAYRSQNLSYWAEAGRMLGASSEADYEPISSGSGTAVVYDLSGLSFSPQIKVEGDTDEDALIRKLRDLEPEFIDFILEALSRREGGAYVTADSRLY